MRTKHIARMLFACACVSGQALAEQSLWAVGKAFDRDTGQLLYIEQHYCEPARKQCSVRYRQPGGDLIARKDLDYRQSDIAPGLHMIDKRRDQEIRIPFAGDVALVVDAGFDNFVREQWALLEADKQVIFPFQGVGFDSPLDMNIRINTDANCAASQLCLAVNIDSWLLSSFFAPIELYYSRYGKRLQRYSGVSNLKGERGESLDVDILYEYNVPGLPDTPEDRVAQPISSQFRLHTLFNF